MTTGGQVDEERRKTVSVTLPRIPRFLVEIVAGFLLLGVGIGIGLIAGGGSSGSAPPNVVASNLSPDDDLTETSEEVVDDSADNGSGFTDKSDCEEKGITRQVGKEGSCFEDGVENVVVNRGSKLKLDELNVSLKDIQVRDSVSSSLGSDSAGGSFVTFTLEVMNKLSSPVYFDDSQSQVSLSVGPGVYTEDFNVQNGYIQDSFSWIGEEIQPQGVQAGTVTFDLPKKVVPKLDVDGNLQILNFTDSTDPESATQQGVIRTYK